ncbi:MAG: photosynthetic complex putative assembly protein PuhB, partial [Betaproteobacteria bacterium]
MNHHEAEMEQLERGGLPEPLPTNERVLWEGAPRWTSLAVRTFHVRKIAIYFAALLAIRIVSNIADGVGAFQALIGSTALIAVASFAIGMMCLLAWLTSRTTWYTITSQRLVMRIGIVLTVTFNVPFKTVGSAGLKVWPDGSGDIPLTLGGDDRIAYLHLWPHARPWHLKRPEPM